MLLQTLPWQALITGLIVLLALAYLARHWWPGSQAKAACHDGGNAVTAAGGCGSGGCSHCPSASSPRASAVPIAIHRHRPQ